MSTAYKTCPECGRKLDEGERCTCKDAELREAAPEAGSEAGEQATRNPTGPALSAGA